MSMSADSSKSAGTLTLLEGQRAPTFSEKLHVGRPNVGSKQRFVSLVSEVLDRGWLTNDGPLVQELEKRVAAYVGVRHCVAMCNATIALEIAIRALGLEGEVIVPSYTFIATAHALQWQNVTPVFADIDERSHCLDPDAVERMITPRTSGIIGVHLWGGTCDVQGLAAVAQRHNLQLMFDAAHAFGCSYKGRMIGSNGRCEVFSFHATKFFNTFEGGAVVTNDDSLDQTMRLMRNFGFAGYDNVASIGSNGKMSEVSAAMGLVNLEALEKIVEANRQNMITYSGGLKNIQGLKLFKRDDSEKCNFQYVVVDAEPGTCPLTRDELIAVLWAENVIARKYFWPGCHRMEPYRSLNPHAGLLLPITESVAARVLLLPTGMAVDSKIVASICSILRTAVSRASEVRAAIATR